MKTTTSTILGIIVAAVLSIVMSSCEKIGSRLHTGEEIRFTAGSKSVDTKASFSGVTAGNKERIDWQTNDLLRIYCAETEKVSADYVVTSVEEASSSSVISTAHILSNEGTGLCWADGETEHTFYAVFPSPAASGVATNITADLVTASLPSAQSVAGITNSGVNYVAAPDMKNMLMTADAGPFTEGNFPKEDDAVFLNFTPLTTALEFTVENGTSADMSISSVAISSESKAICGSFQVKIDAEGIAKDAEISSSDNTLTVKYDRAYPQCTSKEASVTSANKTVSINLMQESTPLTLSTGSKLTFTFFLAPTSHPEDLTFSFTNGAGSTLSTKLGYTDGTGIFFPCHKKTKLSGLMLPEGAKWTITYDPEVVSWQKNSGTLNPDIDIEGGVHYVTAWYESDYYLYIKPRFD